jgi:multiple sugar transport system permease protein
MYERSRTKWLFVGPGILWVLAFTIFPLLYSLRLAFMRARLGQPQTFIGLKNFGRAFSDYRFWDSLEVTLIFAFASVLLTVSLGCSVSSVPCSPCPFSRRPLPWATWA